MPTPPAPTEAGRLLKVLLVGEESAGAQTLKLLARSGHRVAGVLATPQQPVWQLAQQMGYRTWPAAAVKDASFADVIRLNRLTCCSTFIRSSSSRQPLCKRRATAVSICIRGRCRNTLA